MDVKKRRRPGLLLRIEAVLLFIAAIGLIIFLVWTVMTKSNPWVIHKMNADQTESSVLIEMASDTSPYVRIDDMNLEFTGFYMVSADGTVCSYCYRGTIGDANLIVNIPAEDGGELASKTEIEDEVIQNYSVTGQLKLQDEMTSYLAGTEEMTTQEYRDYYHVAAVELDAYDNNSEHLRIYQLMVVVLVVGAFGAGLVLLSEAALVVKESKEEGTDEESSVKGKQE